MKVESKRKFKSKEEAKSPRADLEEIKRHLEQEKYGLEMLKRQKATLEYRAEDVKRLHRNRDFDDSGALAASMTVLEKELKAAK